MMIDQLPLLSVFASLGSISWHLLPLALVISLVYSATRFEMTISLFIFLSPKRVTRLLVAARQRQSLHDRESCPAQLIIPTSE